MSAGILKGLFVLNGWMRKAYRRALVIIGSNKEAEATADFIIQSDAPYFIKGFVNPHTEYHLNCVVPKCYLSDINQLSEIAAKTENNVK